MTHCVFVWKHYGMNALEKYRTENELTYEAMGEKAGYLRGTVYKHCHAANIPEGAALRYHLSLGIPLPELCPALYDNQSPPAMPEKDAA